jgi:DNA-binding response OmpR family regulator
MRDVRHKAVGANCGKVMPQMSATTAPLRILIVEDELANSDLVRASLDALGDPFLRASIIGTAGTLAEARTALAANAFDLLLLDLWLPDGDGLGLVREVSEMGGARPLIVVVSGSAKPEERVEELALVDEFLLKPFDPALLVATINRLAHRQSSHQQGPLMADCLLHHATKRHRQR